MLHRVAMATLSRVPTHGISALMLHRVATATLSRAFILQSYTFQSIQFKVSLSYTSKHILQQLLKPETPKKKKS